MDREATRPGRSAGQVSSGLAGLDKTASFAFGQPVRRHSSGLERGGSGTGSASSHLASIHIR
jgi:hypothetical protein